MTFSASSIPNAFFNIFTVAGLSFIGSKAHLDECKNLEDFAVPSNWVPFPTIVTLRFFRVMKIFQDNFSRDKSDVMALFRFGKVFDGCDIVAMRSSMEFKPKWLRVLEDLHWKPVLPISQLPPVVYDNGYENKTWVWTKDWLDKKAKGSVVYIAFRREAKPSQEELTEIALGLEQSKLPFFLVIRTRQGQANTKLTKLLEGFEERTKGEGLVCTGWVP